MHSMYWKRTQEKGIHSVRSQSEKNNKTDKLLRDIIREIFVWIGWKWYVLFCVLGQYIVVLTSYKVR